MVEGSVLDKRLSSRIAIFNLAQSIVNGVIGVNGKYALKHVEEECKLGNDQLWNHKDTEEKLVPVTHWK